MIVVLKILLVQSFVDSNLLDTFVFAPGFVDSTMLSVMIEPSQRFRTFFWHSLVVFSVWITYIEGSGSKFSILGSCLPFSKKML